MAVTSSGPARPWGLTVISILLVLSGASNGIAAEGNLEALIASFSSLSHPLSFEALTTLEAALGFLSLANAIGFAGGKRWSYRLGLTLPMLGVVVTGIQALVLPAAGLYVLIPVAISVLWLAVMWTYLQRTNVREFLRVATPPVQSAVSGSAPTSPSNARDRVSNLWGVPAILFIIAAFGGYPFLGPVLTVDLYWTAGLAALVAAAWEVIRRKIRT